MIREDHQFRPAALQWVESTTADRIGMSGFAQIGLLRLITTSSAMEGESLSMAEASRVYEAMFRDGRLAFFSEATGLDSKLKI